MKMIYKIEGMSCSHCVMAVKKSLSFLKLQKVDVKIGSAEIEFDPNVVSDIEIKKVIDQAGYKVSNN